MIFDKFVKIKDSAIDKAIGYYSELQKEIESDINEKKEQYKNDYNLKDDTYCNVLNTPSSYLNFIYNSSNFKDYLKYALVVKEMSKKIFWGKLGIVCIALAISILLVFILKANTISLILAVILIIVTSIFMMIQKTNESYESFYRRTMNKLVVSILPNYNFQMTRGKKGDTYYNHNTILSRNELMRTFGKSFSSFIESNTISYSNNSVQGGICDLKVNKRVEQKNKQTGNIETRDETVLDGFYMESQFQEKCNVLGEYMIQIREDENLMSALFEDTVNAMVSSEKNFTFNSEELNKALDCKVRHANIIETAAKKTFEFAKDKIGSIVDKNYMPEDKIAEEVDPVFVLNQVITPVVEERFLFIRKRYNAFNLNIFDSSIEFNVDLRTNNFRKMKEMQFFENDGYKRNTRDVKFIAPNLVSTSDFEYYNIFPMVERLFFIHYMNLVYRIALKYNETSQIEIDIIKQFEQEISGILEMKYSEFKKLYKDEIKEISNSVKDTIEELKV